MPFLTALFTKTLIEGPNLIENNILILACINALGLMGASFPPLLCRRRLL